MTSATDTTFTKTTDGFVYNFNGVHHGPFASAVEATEHCFFTYIASDKRAPVLYPELKR